MTEEVGRLHFTGILKDIHFCITFDIYLDQRMEMINKQLLSCEREYGYE